MPQSPSQEHHSRLLGPHKGHPATQPSLAAAPERLLTRRARQVLRRAARVDNACCGVKEGGGPQVQVVQPHRAQQPLRQLLLAPTLQAPVIRLQLSIVMRIL